MQYVLREYIRRSYTEWYRGRVGVGVACRSIDSDGDWDEGRVEKDQRGDGEDGRVED